MRLKSLSLRNFRNLAVQRLEFPAEGAAIVGPNAQGKTNLLEAIYYLETLRSFRGASDSQLVQFGEDHFRVEAELEGGADGPVSIAAAFDRNQKRKRVQVDGSPVERLGDGLGRLAAVVFSPADVDLVNGGPVERRRHLDVMLSLNQPGYLGAAQRFRQALSQRNAALRLGGVAAVVGAWDPPLVEAGTFLMEARGAWVARWRERFTELYARVSGGERASMAYRPQVVREEGEPWEDAFRRELSQGWERDRRMGSTGTGPHRDELRFTLSTADRQPAVREFGSGGQRRTAALALRLVEGETIRECRSQDPMLLLDDVFAELDEERSARILSLLEEEWSGQVILTAPKESDVRLRGGALTRWTIADGVVHA